MASSDKELELLLMEAGNKLAEPPSSTDDLITLLDQLESFLSRVEQSPNESMLNAVSPSIKALIAEHIFRHPDNDVKVAVAACISEITRITAPDAPYLDDQMKEVFQLIVSSFANLSDKSCRSYIKRTSILETVAKVRSCVVMLDLECDALIVEMFQHFLNAIRDYHADTVFTSMVTIMTLVLEESEDVSMELLSPILACVKRDNEEVLPSARRLAKSVLENCASRLKPYLTQAVENSAISFEDYSAVVASICQVAPNAVGQNDDATDKRVVVASGKAEAPLDNAVQENKEIPQESVLTEQVDLAIGNSVTSVVSNGIVQTSENNTLDDSNSIKKEEDDHLVDKSQNDDNHLDKTIPAKSTEPSDNTNVDENDVESLTKQKVNSKDDAHPTCKDAETSTAGHDGLGGEKVTNSDSKLEESTKEKGIKSHPKSTKPSDSNHVDEKEVETEHKDDSQDDAHPPFEDPSVDGAESMENKGEADVQPSVTKATKDKSKDVASPIPSGTLHCVSHSKRAARPKKKDGLSKETIPYVDDVSKKSSEVKSDSEAKTNKRSGEKVASAASNKDSAPVDVDRSKEESDIASDSDAKPLNQLLKKVDSISNNADGTSSRQLEDKKRRARGKVIPEKDGTKISTKNDDEKMVGSPKAAKPNKHDSHMNETPKANSKGKNTPSKEKEMAGSTKAMKPNKHDTHMDETPKTNSKRKHTPSKEKASDTLEYDENLVGLKVKVWWPEDREFYNGVIQSFDRVQKKHKVWYDDGDLEILNLKKEKWEVIKDVSGSDKKDEADHPSPDGLSEIFQKKKAKTADKPSKKATMDSSPKRGRGASSGISKGAATKSGHKTKEDGKVDGSKSVGKSDNVTKAKEHTFRRGSVTAEIASKLGIQLKNEDTSDTPKSTKSKDDDNVTPKASTKSKQDSSKAAKSVSKVDGSKSVSKSDNVTKAKEHTFTRGSVAAEVASKLGIQYKIEDTSDTPKSTKSKDDDNVTPKASTKSKQDSSKAAKSKQETLKLSSNPKGKPLKGCSKFDANGTGKSKSGSSKGKDAESMEESSTDSAEVLKNAKRKTLSSSKGQGNDSKAVKKRRDEPKATSTES